MNYSENNVSKTRKKLSSSSGKIKKKATSTTARVFFIGFISVLLMGLCLGIGIVKGIIDDAPDIENVNIVPSGYATFIYDADGNQMQKLTAPTSNRMSVSIDKIPMDLQHAVVAVEDERFYEHNGIDIKGIIRAFYVGVSNGFKFTEGASTITQQLLKNNVFTSWTEETTMVEKFKRKFQEQYLAVQLEKEIQDKDVILENYLNTINLGAGTYGVQAAAQKYFNKNVQDLNLSECTVLAGITKNPTKYNPITHPENNAERREEVLKHMVEQEYITEEQRQECLKDDVYTRISIAQAEKEEEENKVYSYFIDELTEQVVQDLQDKKGYTEAQAYQALYSGGLRIYTTQDSEIQKICDEEYSNPENFPSQIEYGIDWALTITKADGTTENHSKEMLASYFQEIEGPEFDLLFTTQEDAQNHIDAYKVHVLEEGDTVVAERCTFTPEPQSSISIIDQHTGYVKAIVGGRGEKTASLTLNRATNTTEQPGSTFKIVSTYAPALEEFGMTLGTVYEDEPYEYANGRSVKNANNSYRGETTIRDAITYSTNIVAVKCLTEITPSAGLEMLKKFGFTTLDEVNDNVQPLALGGIYNGVTNLELTAAYAAIANNGTYIKPVFYTQIQDQDGNVILDNTPQTTQVLSESTAFLLTSAMEDVVDHGTGTALRLNNMAVAGKTGTTSDYRDLWFAGFTPYYTCAIWVGYDNNEVLPNTDIYRTYHKTLWRKIMTRIHEELPYKDFEKPDSVVKATICKKSGKLANTYCENTITEYFAKDTLPTKKCSKHTTPPTPTPTETPSVTPSDIPTDGTDTNVGENTGGGETTNPVPDVTDVPTATPSTPENNDGNGGTGGTGEGNGSEGTTVPSEGTRNVMFPDNSESD